MKSETRNCVAWLPPELAAIHLGVVNVTIQIDRAPRRNDTEQTERNRW